jgi:hypothetical protein
VRQHLEQRVTGLGFFGVYCFLPGTEAQAALGGAARKSGLAYEARMGGKSYEVFAPGHLRNLKTLETATLSGVALGDGLVLDSAPAPGSQSGPILTSAPSTTGTNTLLYIIARFSDQSTDPIDDATALNQMGVVATFWLNNSSGNVSIRGLVNNSQVMDIVHVTLPQPASYAATYNNNFSSLLSDARNAALAQGFNYANYNLDALVTTSTGFSYAGRAWVGGQGCHLVKGYTSLRTAGHELGHNLGLYHANYWRTDSTLPLGKDSNPGGYVADTVDGEWVEYGHYCSVMSAQYGGEIDDPTKPHYAPVEKYELGWLAGSQVQFVSASGTYRLFRHDTRNTTGIPRAIRIETPATDYTGYGRLYWLGYRYAPWNNAQNWFRNGVQVDAAEPYYGSDGAVFLDMSPYSNDQSSPFYDSSSPPGNWWTIDNSDKQDGSLLVGRTFSDRTAGIFVTPIATGNNGAGEEYIDVVINLGTFAANSPPAISSFSVSTNRVNVNQGVTFTVNAADPDADALSYSWDFDQAGTWAPEGLNSASATRSWSTAGQYRVMVTVSDRKGGTATATQVITVGSPSNTNQVWGRVVWAGAPYYGARVWTTNGSTVYQAWTESDGSYALNDLPSGLPFNVNCAAGDLTFNRQFANPVTPTNGFFYGADFYANEPPPIASGGGHRLAGQITDPAVGAPGIEVRCGGLLTTTDASGNYEFTNLPGGTYTVAPSAAGWTFSPATRMVLISSADSTGNNFSRSGPCAISGVINGVPATSQSPTPTVYLSNGRSVRPTRQGPANNRYWGYTLSSVPAGQYSVTAELSGYRIDPSGFSNPLTLSANQSGVNFLGAAASASTVSGRILQYGLPLAGVTVRADQGAVTVASAVTDSDGCYRIANLGAGSFTVVPVLPEYSFTPASVGVPSAPASGVNFAATGPDSPPQITSILASPATVASPGGTTTLSAAASGAGPFSFQWDAVTAAGPVNFSTNDSANASSTIASFQAPGAYTFRVQVKDASGLRAAATVSVTVSAGGGAMVVGPYQSRIISGQSLLFHADAWDALGARLTVTPTWSVSGGGTIDPGGLFLASAPGGPFTVQAAADGLTATSYVWVDGNPSAPIAPSITNQPLARTVPVGSNITFTVGAAGTAPLAYLWHYNGSPISGATASACTLTNVQVAQSGNYSVQITNGAGSVMSSNAALVVLQPPVILDHPRNTLVNQGGTAALSVSATGSGPLQYQWWFQGTNLLAGRTAQTLTLTNVQDASAGSYFVTVSNGFTASSSNATLTINHLPAPDAPILVRLPSEGVKARASAFAGTDPDADPLSVATVDATTTQGGGASLTDGWIVYTPPPGYSGSDTFGFTVSDGRGGTSAGMAQVNVAADTAASVNLRTENQGDGSVLIHADGVPGKTYALEFTEDLANPVWQQLTLLTADEYGAITYLAPPLGGGPPRYYRTTVP